jgi:hypothetical protein
MEWNTLKWTFEPLSKSFEAVITIVFRVLDKVLGHTYLSNLRKECGCGGMAGESRATTGYVFRVSYRYTIHAGAGGIGAI